MAVKTKPTPKEKPAAPKTAVIKKAAPVKVAPAASLQDEEALFDKILAGGKESKADTRAASKGVVKKVIAVKSPAGEAAKSPMASLALGKKTAIIRKGGASKPLPEPVPELVPAPLPLVTAHKTERVEAKTYLEKKEPFRIHKPEPAKIPEKKRKDESFDPKSFAPPEKAILIIREDPLAGDKQAVSYKEFAKPAPEATPGVPVEYEEVEEVVEEVIEEIAYEDTVPVKAAVPGKGEGGGEFQDYGQGFRRRRKKKKRKATTDNLQATDAVKRTMAQINVQDTASKKRYRKEEGPAEVVEESKILKVSDFMSVAEIAKLLNLKPAEVVGTCMKLGIMASINQRLDFTTLAAVIDEFGFTAELMEEYSEDSLFEEAQKPSGEMVRRPPIVTIMGHVDHGKTSLLDYIRKTNVVAGEAGGITQHIGAYRVNTPHGTVAFMDTPGHEAFATMRARGAGLTDIVVLVVAADSRVMPQTIESIDHARAANVRIVVAINKCDLPTANPGQIRNELARHNVIVEDLGGKVVAVEISCKSGKNIDKLLDLIALESELLELKADPARGAVGTVIESKLDPRLGVVATIMITNGTLRLGDNFVTGSHYGRVKAMMDEHGRKVETAGPSTPAQVLGISGTPRAGDSFIVLESERQAREVALKRSQAEKEREARQIKHMSLDDLYDDIKAGAVKDVNIVIKGDVDGSVEALSDSLQKLSSETIKVNIVHKSVGAIKEGDVLLAATTNALVIGFHVYPNSKVRELARQEGVEIRNYKIIYEAVEDMQKALEGMLEPVEKEFVLGSAEVRQVFKVSKVGTIAGSIVTSGAIRRGISARLLRDGVEVAESKVSSLKRLKDDASEVKEGLECGIGLENFNDVKEGDIIEVFEIRKEKVKVKL